MPKNWGYSNKKKFQANLAKNPTKINPWLFLNIYLIKLVFSYISMFFLNL